LFEHDLFEKPDSTLGSWPEGMLFRIMLYQLSVFILPLPRHCWQRAGKILRPGCPGWVTAGNPVPSQAGQSTSVPASLGLGFFMNSFLCNEGNHFHIVMRNGLVVTIVPFESYGGPVLLGDGTLIVLVFAPVNASAYFESSGLITGHCRNSIG
jgi:hypothetical protein